mgnify:FL=1
MRHQRAGRATGVIISSQAELSAGGGDVVTQTLDGGALRERHLLGDQAIAHAGVIHAQHAGLTDGDRA